MAWSRAVLLIIIMLFVKNILNLAMFKKEGQIVLVFSGFVGDLDF